MRNVISITVLTVFSTVLGFVPLAVNAQIAPNQVAICSGEGVQARFHFKLNGKGEALDLRECRTFSGASTFLLYTEYGRQPRYILERQLRGGGRYNITLKSGRYEVEPVEMKRT
ncbi:hypothetical protein Osc7112_0489 [Oscillatoria nigro-viridis PCC 7112]|uniref:Uncharacterized protein n=1 Tax=Phormidium nigroviride PCC 7112 TaxID=179408 RepID=K9VC77_9CYAN|nr:hypothetical protein [Oscillatoria nigro-viridis]AFZ05094.1 hypothetical protein Osc7112_0489 [Oscillatoria nigro-viridis PCC 7112]